MTTPARDGRLSRRRLLTGLATAGTLALAGCGESSGGDGGPSPTPNPPEGPVADAPIPDTPGDYRYAMMGSGEAGLTVTYYGNWKCPFCAEFSTGKLADLVTEYVVPGDVDLEYRAIARFDGQPFLGEDAAAASRAGLEVWTTEPASYWPFHEYVMANQPPESESWATPERLARMATVAGVTDVEAVRDAAASDTHSEAVTATGTAALSAGVDSTPALVAGDRVVNPLRDSKAREAIEAALA